MKRITEEDGIHKDWYKKNPKNLEELMKFLKSLQEDYSHDYGTICHALAAGAVATCHALNSGPQGGITGFQAGAVMWEFIRYWMGYKDEPMRLLRYKNMLYPQYEKDYRTISKETWDWLQSKAKERLSAKGHAHGAVVAHWKSIIDGKVPFGYQVEKE